MQESEHNKLTDILALNISERLGDKHNIRKLFSSLKVEGHIIETTINNNVNDTTEIAHKLMTQWRQRMKDSEEAYTTLWNALIHEEVNLPGIAYEVLKEHPMDKISDKSAKEDWRIRYALSLDKGECSQT